MFDQGDTFYGGGELHGKDHLWIVINKPWEHDGKALYVNITSVKGGKFDDLTCVLQKGEHPFIERPSFIRFNGAKSALVTELDQAEAGGLITRAEKASEGLVQKIRRAASVSSQIEPEPRSLL